MRIGKDRMSNDEDGLNTAVEASGFRL